MIGCHALKTPISLHWLWHGGGVEVLVSGVGICVPHTQQQVAKLPPPRHVCAARRAPLARFRPCTTSIAAASAATDRVACAQDKPLLEKKITLAQHCPHTTDAHTIDLASERTSLKKCFRILNKAQIKSTDFHLFSVCQSPTYITPYSLCYET